MTFKYLFEDKEDTLIADLNKGIDAAIAAKDHKKLDRYVKELEKILKNLK